MNERSPDDADTIISAFHTVHLALHAATVSNWLDLELSMAQLKTLFVVARLGSTAIGQVAETLQVGLPTASHLVERLVQEGLVDRTVDAEDRRRSLAALTPRGEQLVARLRQGSVTHMRAWTQLLSDKERNALAFGLQALAQVAQASSHDEVAAE